MGLRSFKWGWNSTLTRNNLEKQIDMSVRTKKLAGGSTHRSLRRRGRNHNDAPSHSTSRKDHVLCHGSWKFLDLLRQWGSRTFQALRRGRTLYHKLLVSKQCFKVLWTRNSRAWELDFSTYLIIDRAGCHLLLLADDLILCWYLGWTGSLARFFFKPEKNLWFP